MMWSLFDVMYYATQSIATFFTDNMELLYVTNKINCMQ